MKSTSLTRITAVTLFAAAITLLAALAIPERLAAKPPQHSRYKLIDMGTFGGPSSQFSNPDSRVLNSRGTAAGYADTSVPDPNCLGIDCFFVHAFMWRNGVRTDLGTLPEGGNSFALGVSDRGLIVGQSTNGSIDPLTGAPEFDVVLWDNGQIMNLGTLGGTQGIANATNKHDQVVGGALTATPDPFANSPQSACQVLVNNGNSCSGFPFAFNTLFAPATTETHAFLWQNGFMSDLGTLGGPDSNAWVINDHGQVAGWSYTSFVANPSSGVPTVDPFLWSPEDGKMTDLGSLGGTFGAPFWLNNRGQVVGTSNLAGDQTWHPFLWDHGVLKDLGTLGGNDGEAYFISESGDVVGRADVSPNSINHHAFLWKNGVMTDLGILSGGPCSTAYSVNSRDQVVGSAGICFQGGHGFLSENGQPIVDLATLVLPGSNITVNDAFFINDRGEIAGTGVLPNGDQHAVLLIPCDKNHADDHANDEGCD
jgi:probable HAF family extracellular repeat protein